MKGGDSSLDDDHDPHSPSRHNVYLPPEQGLVVPHAQGEEAHAEQHRHNHKTSRMRGFFRKMRHLGQHHDHSHGHEHHDGDAQSTAHDDDGEAPDHDTRSLSRGSGSSEDVGSANGGDAHSLTRSGAATHGDAVPHSATEPEKARGPSNRSGAADVGGDDRRQSFKERTTPRAQRQQGSSVDSTPAASAETSPPKLRRRPGIIHRHNTHPRTAPAPARHTVGASPPAATGDARTTDDTPRNVKVFDEATEPQVSGSVRLSRDKRELVDIKGLPNMLAEYARFKARKLLVLFSISLAAHIAVAFVLAVLLRVLFPSTLIGAAEDPTTHGQQHPSFFQLLYHTFVGSVAGTADSGFVRNPGASAGALLLMMNVYVGFVLRCLAVLGIVYVSTATPTCLVFSKWAAITSKSLTGLRSLEFRLVNQFGFEREMLDAHARVTLSITPRRNPTRRRFFPLRLVQDTQAVMPVMWTLSHVIDHTSPLYDQDTSSLEDNMVLLEVVVDCVDPVTRKRMYHRHTYGAANILFHAEFATVADTSRFPNKAFLDFTKFHRVYQHPQ